MQIQYSEKELEKVAKTLLDQFPNSRLFAFYAPMGAGKTTLIKEICRQLEVKDSLSSPTFSLINTYVSENGDPIYHFDFYRLESEEEAYDYGYEDYLYSGNYCFMEWPDKIENLIPENTIEIKIEVVSPSTRKISC